MAASWFARPGVAFAWIAVELVAFAVLMGVATLWEPQAERILREAGVTLSAASERAIAAARCLRGYGWLLLAAILLSLFVKAGVVRARPDQARPVAISSVVMALLFLGLAIAMVGCLTASMQAFSAAGR